MTLSKTRGVNYARDFSLYDEGWEVTQGNIYAHMWRIIRTSTDDEGYADRLYLFAREMTVADVGKAQELARECVKKNYKGC